MDPPVLSGHRVMAVLGLGLWKVVLAIVIVDWTRFARVVRGEVLALRERESWRRHGHRTTAVPRDGRGAPADLVPLIIVLVSLEMAIAVGVEALLFVVGLGVEAQPRRGVP